MQANQAQKQALLARTEAGRQREAAAAQATADERRAREVCDGIPSFRHFCHWFCFAVKDVRDCHSPLSCKMHVFCTAFLLMLVGSRPTSQFCTHEM